MSEQSGCDEGMSCAWRVVNVVSVKSVDYVVCVVENLDSVEHVKSV